MLRATNSSKQMIIAAFKLDVIISIIMIVAKARCNAHLGFGPLCVLGCGGGLVSGVMLDACRCLGRRLWV